MGFNLKLLLASTLLCLHLFVSHGFALPFGSVFENGSRLFAGFFNGCPCFGPADACFSLNRTDITDSIPCFETLHLCLVGCSLPDQTWYNDAIDDGPKSHRSSTTPTKNVSPTEVAGLIEAPLVEKRLTCLEGCYSTWNVCQGWAVVFHSTYAAHIATCDYFFEYCATNNCHLPVQPRPPRVEERDPTPALKPTGTACTTFCQQGWQICVALVDGSEGMFAPSDCNKYEEGCINDCDTPVHPETPSPKGDLAPRAAATPVNAWAEICDIHCGQGWQVCVELINNGKLKLPLKDCDDDTQQCQTNCWARKRDGGMSPSGVSLVERSAATPVNAWAEICNINCEDGWQICVALVDGSKGKFSLKGCDTYMQSCQTACWNGKRDSPITLAHDGTVSSASLGKRDAPITLAHDGTVSSASLGKLDAPIALAHDGTVSSASLGKRDPANPNTKGKKECQNLCNDRFIICMALVNGSEGKFGDRGCYEDIDRCSNNCKAPPTDAVPIKRRDSSMSDALLDKRDAEPLGGYPG